MKRQTNGKDYERGLANDWETLLGSHEYQGFYDQEILQHPCVVTMKVNERHIFGLNQLDCLLNSVLSLGYLQHLMLGFADLSNKGN